LRGLCPGPLDDGSVAGVGGLWLPAKGRVLYAAL
jgi:hypothetical protein